MARLMRAFTISETTLEAFDELVQAGALSTEVQELLTLTRIPSTSTVDPPVQQEPPDVQGLRPDDYAALYALLPPAKTKSPSPGRVADWTSRRHERKPAWEFMEPILRDLQGKSATAHYVALVMAEVKARRKANRSSARAPDKPSLSTVVNASRIADALLSLGLATLKARVAQRDVSTKPQARKRKSEAA